MPAERVAPSGTPEIVIERDSEPSVSVRAADRSSAITVSSLPEALETFSSGALAVVSNSGTIEVETVALSPSFSVEVAATSIENPAFTPAGTFMVKPFNCSGVRVHEPSALCVPADSVTPAGSAPTVIESVSEPSVSVSAAWISSG